MLFCHLSQPGTGSEIVNMLAAGLTPQEGLESECLPERLKHCVPAVFRLADAPGELCAEQDE